jgi:hypothetical protein
VTRPGERPRRLRACQALAHLHLVRVELGPGSQQPQRVVESMAGPGDVRGDFDERFDAGQSIWFPVLW